MASRPDSSQNPVAPSCVEDSASAPVPAPETEFHGKPRLALPPVILSGPSERHPRYTVLQILSCCSPRNRISRKAPSDASTCKSVTVLRPASRLDSSQNPAAPPCVEDSAPAPVSVSETELHGKPCLALQPAILSRFSGWHPGRTPAKTPLHRPALGIPLRPPFPSPKQNYTKTHAWRFRLQFCHCY